MTVRASQAEYRIEPAIMVSEEYNDNVFLAPSNPQKDEITRVVPSILYVYTAPIWKWDIAYAYDYRYYAHRSKEHDYTQSLVLSNRTALIGDNLALEISDIYKRVSLDVIQDYTRQSLFVNQTDSNDLIAGPFLKFSLTSHTSGTTGYQYRNLWYKDPSAIDSREHAVYLDLADELSLRTVLSAGARGVKVENKLEPFTMTEVFVGPRYEYAEGSALWLLLGNTWFDTENSGDSSQFKWDLGFEHKFLTYTLAVSAALRYIDDPERVKRREDRYAATVSKETERISLAATAGLWEYRNLLTKHLENTKYELGGVVGYRFSESFRTVYSLTVDRYEDNRAKTYSMLYLNILRLEYALPAGTRVALDYRFEHGYSPDAVNYNLNYDNNRVILEVSRIF